jgi:hypothetical protein
MLKPAGWSVRTRPRFRLDRRQRHLPQPDRDPQRGIPPSAQEVDHAGRVVAAYDKALAEGVGAVTVDGRMIDVPVVERARLLLEREAAVAAREAEKRAAGARFDQPAQAA